MKDDAGNTGPFEHYSEQLVFAMRDTYCGFSLGLGSVLECLATAEREGYVPPIPKEWWDEVERRGGETAADITESFH